MRARLHLVTDDTVLRSPDFTERAQAVLAAHGEALALHLRGHGLEGRELFRLAEALAFAADTAGAELLINDRVDVALAAGADGVQLGRRSLPVSAVRALLGVDAWIGYSAHDLDEARTATEEGADVLLLGTVYPSASHPGRAGAGLEFVRRVAGAVAAPIIAIGGVTPARVAELQAAGAYGVAVRSGVWHAADPVAAARRYITALYGGDHGSHDGNDRGDDQR